MRLTPHGLKTPLINTIKKMKLTVSLFSGFTSIIPLSRFWQSGGTKCGMWNTPRLTFSNSCLKLSSSKGRAPTKRAYKITPQDQTSAFRPSYFSPWKETQTCEPLPLYESRAIHVDAPEWLPDMRSEESHSWSPAWIRSAAKKPSRSRRFWCCSFRREEDSRASNLCDWKRKSRSI